MVGLAGIVYDSANISAPFLFSFSFFSLVGWGKRFIVQRLGQVVHGMGREMEF